MYPLYTMVGKVIRCPCCGASAPVVQLCGRKVEVRCPKGTRHWDRNLKVRLPGP
jgi:hypothetical protein